MSSVLGAQGASGASGTGGSAWTSPGNALTSNNSYATVTVGTSANVTTAELQVTNFATALSAIGSSDIIDGVEVLVERKGSSHLGTVGEHDAHLYLYIDGSHASSNDYADTATFWGTSDATITYGGPTDLWGYSSLTGADIKASNSGVVFQAFGKGPASGTGTISVDAITINVYYHVGTQTVDPTGITSGETFGSPTIQPGRVSVVVGNVATAEAFGTPTIHAVISLFPTGVSSGEAFGTPVITVGTALLLPTGITSGEAFGSLSILPGGVSTFPSGISSTETFGTPTIQAIISLALSGISSAEAFGTPTLIPGVTLVFPEGIVSAESVNPITLSAIITLIPTGISSGAFFGTPAIYVAYDLEGNLYIVEDLSGDLSLSENLLGDLSTLIDTEGALRIDASPLTGSLTADSPLSGLVFITKNRRI